MASPFQSSPFLKCWGGFFCSNDSAVYFPLPASSFILWASLFHPLCSMRKVRDSSFSLMQAGGGREWLRALEKERRGNSLDPQASSFWPSEDSLRRVHPTALAGLPSRSACPGHHLFWKKKTKISWERLVSWLKPESMHPKLEAQTARIHSWANYQPCCQTRPCPVIWKKPPGIFHQPFRTSWGEEGYPQPEIRSVIKQNNAWEHEPQKRQKCKEYSGSSTPVSTSTGTEQQRDEFCKSLHKSRSVQLHHLDQNNMWGSLASKHQADGQVSA